MLKFEFFWVSPLFLLFFSFFSFGKLAPLNIHSTSLANGHFANPHFCISEASRVQCFLWYYFFFFSLQVSWIRTRGIRVLAIGKVRYTQDTRFTPLHEEGNDVWVLKIQETRLSDAGLYECQVSYHEDVEKKLKMPVRLIVLGKRRRVIHVMYSALNLNSPL